MLQGKIKEYLDENDIMLRSEYQKKFRQILLDNNINPNSSFLEMMATFSGEFSGKEGTIMNVAEDLSNIENSYILQLQKNNNLSKDYLQLLTPEYDDYLLYNRKDDSVILIEGMNDNRLEKLDFDKKWNSFNEFLEDFFELY